MRWTLAASAILVALVPTASAGTYIELTAAEVSLVEARHIQELEYDGEPANALRTHLDEAHGNGDGRVDKNEINDYQDGHKIYFNATTKNCFDVIDWVRIDGQHVLDRIVMTEHLSGTLGPITSSSPVRIRTTTTYAFPPSNRTDGQAEINFGGNHLGSASSDCYSAEQGHVGWDNMDHFGWGPTFFPDNMESPLRETRPAANQIHPLSGFSLDRRTVEPRQLEDLWDGTGWSERDPSAPLRRDTVKFMIVEGTITYPAATPADMWQWLVVFGPVGAVSFAMLIWAFEALRIWFFRHVLVAVGFTRLEQDDVLRNRRRGEILQRIREEPGISFSELRRSTEIPNGPLVHHLRVLQRQGLFHQFRDGIRVRYFPRDSHGVFVLPRTSRQQKILQVVTRRPGISQRELAHELGWSRLAVNRSASQLAIAGDLRVVRDGRRRRYVVGQRLSINVAPPRPGLIRKEAV